MNDLIGQYISIYSHNIDPDTEHYIIGEIISVNEENTTAEVKLLTTGEIVTKTITDVLNKQ